MDVRNPTSDYEIREKVVIRPTEYVEQDESSKIPQHHFAITWEGSKKTSTMTVLTADELNTVLKKESKKGRKKGGNNPNMIRSITMEDSNEFVPVAAFDVRGVEPYAFHPMGGEFVVKSEGGYSFDCEDVDLSEGEWADYDLDNSISVSITDLVSKFESV